MSTELALATLAGLFYGLIGIGLVRGSLRWLRPDPRVREWLLRAALLLPVVMGARAFVDATSTAQRMDGLREALVKEVGSASGLEEARPAALGAVEHWLGDDAPFRAIQRFQTIELVARDTPESSASYTVSGAAVDPIGTIRRSGRSVDVRAGWSPGVRLGLGLGALAWGVGIVFGGVRLARSAAALRRWIVGSSPAPRQLIDEAATEARMAGTLAPRVRLSEAIPSPFAAPGHLLVLPEWFASMGAEARRAVLAHEVAHLRRRDPARQILMECVRILLWPVPFVSWALGELRVSVEHRCDDWAIERSGGGLGLARALAEVAERVHQKDGMPLGAFVTGAPLAERVERAIGTPPRTWNAPAIGVGLILLLGSFVLPPLRPPGEFSVEVKEFSEGGFGDALAALDRDGLEVDEGRVVYLMRERLHVE